MGSCKNCKSKNLVSDDETGNLVCSSCGVVQEFDNYQHDTYNVDGPIGSTFRVGKSGSGYDYSYRETKIYLAQKIVSDILFKLDLESRVDEVNSMIKVITEEEYGTGDWFNVLVGACIYVVMRKANKPLPLTRVCSCIGCDNYELGRMVYRVVDHLDLRLPEFDIVELFDRVTREWVGSKGGIEKDMVGRMLKQGIFLIQCMIRWFVTTGRRPVPVVVAVVVFVCQLNEVEVSMEDLASNLNVPVVTCKLRHKELLERLVEVARDHLPWGKDVTVKNVMKNALYVIRYMEMKSMSKNGKESKSLEEVGVDLDGLISDCLNRGDDGYFIDNCEFDGSEHSTDWSNEDLEKLHLSHECLSAIYLKYLDEVSTLKSKKESVEHNRRAKRIRQSDALVDPEEYWSGESELSKKLFLKKILEKDVGLNAMPPSFVSGCLANQRRREKIKAARLRIEKIWRPPGTADGLGKDNELCVSSPVNVSNRKKRGKKVDTDWEDFVIETLLLHQVKEEEIEKGYYNTLLDLHVFNSGGPAVEDIRSRCLRLSDQSTSEALAVRTLLGHRLPLDAREAKLEWYRIVEGEHPLWRDVSKPYSETIGAFLVYFQNQDGTILRGQKDISHAHSTSGSSQLINKIKRRPALYSDNIRNLTIT